MRQRSPILSLLQFAIIGYIFWRFYQSEAFDPNSNPTGFSTGISDLFPVIFFGIIALFALNLLYPLVAWGIGKLRQRQAAREPEERFVVSRPRQRSDRQDRICPNCGASLFDDSSTCPWCGHPLT